VKIFPSAALEGIISLQMTKNKVVLSSLICEATNLKYDVDALLAGYIGHERVSMQDITSLIRQFAVERFAIHIRKPIKNQLGFIVPNCTLVLYKNLAATYVEYADIAKNTTLTVKVQDKVYRQHIAEWMSELEVEINAHDTVDRVLSRILDARRIAMSGSPQQQQQQQQQQEIDSVLYSHFGVIQPGFELVLLGQDTCVISDRPETKVLDWGIEHGSILMLQRKAVVLGS